MGVPGSPEPRSRGHLSRIFRELPRHENRARPHAALGPGISDLPETAPVRLPRHFRGLSVGSPAGSPLVSFPLTSISHHPVNLPPHGINGTNLPKTGSPSITPPTTGRGSEHAWRTAEVTLGVRC